MFIYLTSLTTPMNGRLPRRRRHHCHWRQTSIISYVCDTSQKKNLLSIWIRLPWLPVRYRMLGAVALLASVMKVSRLMSFLCQFSELHTPTPAKSASERTRAYILWVCLREQSCFLGSLGKQKKICCQLNKESKECGLLLETFFTSFLWLAREMKEKYEYISVVTW